MKIFKYPLVPEAMVNVITVPKGSVPLSCGLDPRNVMCVWMVVNPDAVETECRNVYVWGTGWDMGPIAEKDCEFLGTVNDGDFMWHVFVEDAV